MPKIVDHDVRREEVLNAAIRVICRVGLDKTTTRLIAVEAGYSNGVLVNYFDDKDAILQSVVEMTHRLHRSRTETLLRGKDPMAALEALVFQELPLDEERRVETLLEMSFWTRAASNPVLAAFQTESANQLLRHIRMRIRDVRDVGLLHSDLSDSSIAELLISVIDGMSVHSILFPTRLPPRSMRKLMRAELRALGFELPTP